MSPAEGGASGETEEDPEIPEKKSPTEVIKDLEDTLSATVEELEQQRRLNQSLCKRKVVSTLLLKKCLYLFCAEFQRGTAHRFSAKASSQLHQH